MRSITHPKLSEKVVKRFWAKVDSMHPSGCWLWLGTRNRLGYGQISIKGRGCRAHRISYELHKGSIPVGLVLDHLCRNPSCVNPAHLEAVTSAENIRRGLRRVGNDGKPVRTATEKQCYMCRQFKPFDQFHNRKKSADGRSPECKECNVVRIRERDRKLRAVEAHRAAKSTPTIYHGKVGTMPASIVLWGRTKITVGNRVKFRDYHHGSKWEWGIVDKVNPDGYYFITKM